MDSLNSSFNEDRFSINAENEERREFKNNLINNHLKINKKSKKCKKIPFIIIPTLFTFLFFITSLIFFIIISQRTELPYTYEEKAYIKPKYSSHEYSSVEFKNGLKLLLVQVDSDDVAGGSITFDYGYLNNKFNPGYLKLAFLSLISENVNNSESYIDYLGKFNYEVEKYYSSFYFQILGGGFENYLKDFATLTYLNNKDERFNQIKNVDLTVFNDFNEKRNHLLEFLIYGYNDSKGKDIIPQGNNNIKKALKGNYTKIINIMKYILSDPSKIKIVLYSHYKISFMKKYFLSSFKEIINRPKKDNNEIKQNAYNISEFSTNKIIFYLLNNIDDNYIEINYFLKRNITYEQLIKDSHYLNYIIYILNQTDENSLYYELNNNNISIKSLSSNYEIVLKSKIKFSILIKLNHYSYEYLHEIISKIYNYINNIILYINSYKDIINDIRLEELDKISEQNFTFTEDAHESIFYKKLANDLFYKDKKDYLLKQMIFSKKNFIENITIVKFYFNQLTLNNSVIFFGFNNNTINNYNLRKSEINYLFNKTARTSLFKIIYSSNKLDEHINPLYDDDYSKLLVPKKNEYISQYGFNSELEYNKSDYDNYYQNHEEIKEKNDYIKVFWKKGTNFKIPKIHTTIFFFHPFLRPNLQSEDSGTRGNDRLYFEISLYFAYLKRTIVEQLADVFRAGNSFLIDYNENYYYMNFFFYSDIAEKAFEIINDIFSEKDKFLTELESHFEIYRDIVLEDFIAAEGYDLMKFRYTFFNEITKDKDNKLPPIYNHYNFPRYEYFDKTYNDMDLNELNSDLNLIKYFYLFGYLNKTNVTNIYRIFNTSNNFDSSLDLAGYDISHKINVKNFVEWSLNKSFIGKSDNISITSDFNGVNRFMYFTEFSLKYSCLCDMLINILTKNNNFMKKIRRFHNFNQKYIFLLFIFRNGSLEKNEQFLNDTIKWLNESESMTKEVDIIGDRFYYLLKSHKRLISIKHDNMIDSALTITYNTLYNIHIDDNNDLNFEMEEYQDFFDEITKYINPNANYIDIIPIRK